MNRNEYNHFWSNPVNLDISRSRFPRNCSVKTSFNVGSLIPFYVDEVLPGDTFEVTTSKLVRLQTLITPMMDNLYLDTYYYFVPSRLVWEHWREFNGENTKSAWAQTVQYEVPQVAAPSGGWQVGTIADYMGIPTGISNLSVNALPFRAYSLIVNEFFRDQNLQDPVNISLGDTTVTGSNGGNYISDLPLGGKPFKACKMFDYFTGCLPAPQKGPAATIGIGGGEFPLLFYSSSDGSKFQNPLSMNPVYGAAILEKDQPSSTQSLSSLSFKHVDSSTDVVNNAVRSLPLSGVKTSNSNDYIPVTIPNGYVDVKNVDPFSINDLRLAFQVQRLLEKNARGGTRYIEILKSRFGVTSPDARLQRPEYLGGNRLPININQVIQNSATAPDQTPQGNVSGMSVTSDTHEDFTKSFVEHGFVIGLCLARYEHSYQQGLERFWSRKTLYDYYIPVFSNIGEMAVLNKEIFAQGTAADEEVFGYQEAWADYRYKPSHVTGEMRSNHNLTLDSWHLADDYDSLPHLSAEWIQEDEKNVDRVIAVTSDVSNQVFADFYIENMSSRPMPLYSIPGLIDHH